MKEERKYYYNNPETGEYQEISKELWDQLNEMKRIPGVGKVFITSTAGDLWGDFKYLWESDEKENS
jgi:hypothetical protein